jgi:hypothetical protein
LRGAANPVIVRGMSLDRTPSSPRFATALLGGLLLLRPARR